MGLGAFGEQGVRTLFRQADTNRNGQLDISEAMSVFERISSLLNRGQGQ